MIEDKYLFNRYPLIVVPELAVKVGLNEAIFLQQLKYWLNKSDHVINGQVWIYNTYDEWQKQFPFWSLRTIKRIKTSLVNKGIVKVGRFNKKGYDKTNWYAIDHEKYAQLVARPSCQSGTSMVTSWHYGTGQSGTTNTRDYTETTTETTTTNMSSSKLHDHSSAKEVIAYLNEKAGKHFRNTASNYRLIEPRLKDYSVDELKQVIDNKCSEWLGTDMDKYLRIETLFRASKIDGYLNEHSKKGHDVNGLDF